MLDDAFAVLIGLFVMLVDTVRIIHQSPRSYQYLSIWTKGNTKTVTNEGCHKRAGCCAVLAAVTSQSHRWLSAYRSSKHPRTVFDAALS
jgi:hypothetical protein